MNIKILEKMLTTTSISGFEYIVNKEIAKIMDKDFVRTVDPLGNNYYVTNHSGKKHIVIVNHIDETGFIVSKINKNGTLKVLSHGGFNLPDIINAQLIIYANDGKEYNGIFFRNSKALDNKTNQNTIANYFVDCGLKNDKDASKHQIRIGTMVGFKSIFLKAANNRIICKSADNRVNAGIILSNIDKIKQIAKANDVKITICFSVQEEIGLRGSKVINENTDPDAVIVTDITPSFETIDSTTNTNYAKMGQGPDIRVKDAQFITPQNVIEYIESCVKEIGIKAQYTISAGAMDSASVSQGKNGVITIPLTFCYRYNHGPSQLFDLDDAQNFERLLLQVLKKLDTKKINSLGNRNY